MVKKIWKTGCHLLVILLAATVLISALREDPQSPPPPCQQLNFIGEYSLNDGPWQPLNEATAIPSALGGDLMLRGRFHANVPQGQSLFLYLDHLTYRLTVNGQQVAASSDLCHAFWKELPVGGIQSTDTVEIRLSNPHRFGNASAYIRFLDSLCSGSVQSLDQQLSSAALFCRAAGSLLLALSAALLGVALTFSLKRISSAYSLWTLGTISLAMGFFILLAAPDISLLVKSPLLLSRAAVLCLMVAVLQINVFLANHLEQKGRTAASIALAVQCAGLAAMFLVSLLSEIPLYDLLLPWAAMQLLLCPILLICCIAQWRLRRNFRDLKLLAAFVLLLCLLVEIPLSLLPTFPHGMLFTGVFFVLFLLLIFQNVGSLAAGQQKAGQVDYLETELRNSRIVLATSQIRTHFIFNALNAISGMCKYDPEKADRTIVRFARYLRTNIDIMQADTPISFRAALRHVEDYIVLEQMRFGDRLRFVTDIGADDFMIPPLVLQPLVENSIQHGLSVKSEGGTITLRTRREKDNILVTIEDDGVGFDPSAAGNVQSVGLKNVRFRLQHMANATLDIDSTPGHGTVYTISIPKKEASLCM